MEYDMGWDEDVARDRVDEHDFHDFEVSVADLSREMELNNLGLKDVRRANAAHIYVDVPNFHALVRAAGGNKEKQKKLMRAASVLRKLQTELLKSPNIVGDEAMGRIQLQATRLHALCFRPYGDEATRAAHAVVMAISMNSLMHEVFNEVFSDFAEPFTCAVGISSGKALIANLGLRGERERISLGSPANLAAKILGPAGTIRVTSDVYDLLPDDLKSLFSKLSATIAGSDVYEARGIRWGDREELAETLDVVWKPTTWKERAEAKVEDLPLHEMEVAWAEALIDPDQLTERNSKRCEAIAIYADLDGFTALVQAAEKDDKVVSLVRELHMIRRELHMVLHQDFANAGLVLQHQGDRLFAIFHMPSGEDEADSNKRRRKALDAAIGLQSSMIHVLKKKLAHRPHLKLAIGVDVGNALVTRLGTKGKREIVCVGPGVSTAERRQLSSKGGEIRISQSIYEAISRDAIRDFFKRDGDGYLATDLTFPKIEEAETRKSAKAGTLGAVASAGKIVTTVSGAASSKPWGCNG
jgi:class 3 adenylate cyclase